MKENGNLELEINEKNIINEKKRLSSLFTENKILVSSQCLNSILSTKKKRQKMKKQ